MSNEIAIEDYVEGMEPITQDPSDPHEKVERKWLNKVALLLTTVEEALQSGRGDVSISDLSKFIEARGEVLDRLDDPDITGWLDHMRKLNRCRFRRFPVG